MMDTLSDVERMAGCLTAEGYVTWWLERTGQVNFKHFDHPNEDLGSVTDIHKKFGEPSTFTAEELREAVDVLHEEGRVFASAPLLVREAISGRKNYPAEYTVGVQLR